MEFDKSRVYTAVNADELRAGDKVIAADDMTTLKMRVEANEEAYPLDEVCGEDWEYRFCVVLDKASDLGSSFSLAYLVERKENCTNCRLCNGSIKDDPTEVCENYEPQAEPPANCETCSKADTDRCPVPNPPKETGCGHWESKPARVCENCRNLECHGKDNNWCEVREIKLSDEAIKKNTCGYLKLVKAEKHYRPFKDTDELIKVWLDKGGKWQKRELTMPFIWVRKKDCGSELLITGYNKPDGEVFIVDAIDLTQLFDNFTFLDGSPCGVEE